MTMPLLRLVLRLIVVQTLIGLLGIVIAMALGAPLSQGVIAFVDETNYREFDIYVVDVVTTITHNLTNSPFSDLYPTWSPDGSQLAFMSRPDGLDAIFIMSASGRNVRRITDINDYASSPAWSPNGRYLAYIIRVQNSNRSDIRLFDIQTGAHHVLTPLELEDNWPVWSPDGTLLAFTVTDRLALAEPPVGLYILDITQIPSPDQGLRRVRDFPYNFKDAAWSPDIRRIAISQLSEDRTNWELAIVDISTGALTVLPRPSADDFEPEWSPDGTMLAFVSRVRGDVDADIYLFNLITREVRQLTGQPFNDYYPIWLPNGDEIAYTSVGYRTVDVNIININSGTLRTLTSGVVTNGLFWRPG